MSLKSLPLAVAAVALLSGCNAGERLARIGKEPELRPIENPVEQPDYRPVSLPMPLPEPTGPVGPASLWQRGARHFFEDQRASTVGDILTVDIFIADEATLENETSRARSNEESLGIGSLFSLPERINEIAGEPVGLESETLNLGRGSVAREEDIALQVAAVVTQVLPNGNLVIQGRQEVRVNYEVRELWVAGVVRPEDIRPDNTVPHDEIAELRVAYGGRGVVSDIQQPRYGSQVLDIILPF